jgi:DNA mismatch repair protein MLH3
MPSVRFTKEDLACAEVISQVDQKFVACIVQGSGGTSDFNPFGEPAWQYRQDKRYHMRTLVLLDQHAADERVRVEHYLREICLGFLHHSKGKCAPVRTLKPPTLVLLTAAEVRLLSCSPEAQHALSGWGITLHIPAGGEEPQTLGRPELPSYKQVFIDAIPEVIADKVRNNPPSNFRA